MPIWVSIKAKTNVIDTILKTEVSNFGFFYRYQQYY